MNQPARRSRVERGGSDADSDQLGTTESSSCRSCRENSDQQVPVHGIVFRNDMWLIRHAPPPYGLAGWMVIQPMRHVAGVQDFTDEEAANFGPFLRHCQRVLQETTGAARMYTAAMGESTPHVHIHMVPRYEQMPNDSKGWSVFELQLLAESRAITVESDAVEAIVMAYRHALTLDPPPEATPSDRQLHAPMRPLEPREGTVVVRPYEDGDLESIAEITKRAWGGMTMAELRERRFGLVSGRSWQSHKVDAVTTDIAANPSGTLVACVGTTVVGYGTFRVDGDVGTVGNNAVDPEWQGKGIGSALLGRVVDSLVDSGVTMLEVVTFQHDLAARAIYEKFGFEEIATSVHLARAAHIPDSADGQPSAAPSFVEEVESSEVVH